ncbi:MAG: hypothetical protein M1838_005919 [Thelocarpon superellum]|nr:MAG: hypothetical protein M1838_005919 [Thelocarpon superellum]
MQVHGRPVHVAELESYLREHEAVGDVAVISESDGQGGQLAKALVIQSAATGLEESEWMLIRQIKRHVEKHRPSHEWLWGGVEFVDVLPRPTTGAKL